MRVKISDYAWFDASELTRLNIEKLKGALTIKRRRTHRLQDDPAPVLLYREDGGRFGIPRSFFLEHRRREHQIELCVSNGSPISVDFVGELTKDQLASVDTIVRDRQNGGLGSIIQATTGWGKTVAAIGVITRMKRSTLVVVNKRFIQDQWVKRLKGIEIDGRVVRPGFAPGARVGIIRGNKCQFGDDYDISIATIQTLKSRSEKFPPEFWSSFGLVITDEVHRVAAPTWVDVATMFTAAYRLGITATPRRKDGAQNVFFHHIGPIIYKSDVPHVIPRLRRVFTSFTLRRTRDFDPNRAGKEVQLRLLCANVIRNRLIVSELVSAASTAEERCPSDRNLCRKEICKNRGHHIDSPIPGRKILVLSERRMHLERLSDAFNSETKGRFSTDFYVGGRKQHELDIAETADVIFATYQMASEALDIPSLDTVFLTTPVLDPEQAIGRIMRAHDAKCPAVVTDFIDEGVKYFAGLWNKRRDFYVSRGIYKP